MEDAEVSPNITESSIPMERIVDKEEFYRKIAEILVYKSHNSFLFKREKYNETIIEVKKAKAGLTKTPKAFRLKKQFIVIDTPQLGERLFTKLENGAKVRLEYVTIDEMYDILVEYHLKLNHGGRTRMTLALKKKYKNITTESVNIFLSLCETCKDKHNSRSRKSTYNISKNIYPNEDSVPEAECNLDMEFDYNIGKNVSSPDPLVQPEPELFSRGQVDILNVTSENSDEYLMIYRNLVTEFIHLEHLKTTTVEETADSLLEIFLIFGAPNILQSKNGISVSKPVCRRVQKLCPDIKIIASEQLYSDEPYGRIDNEKVLKMISDWLEKNPNQKWQNALKYVQHCINTTFNPRLCRSASEAVFNTNPRKGLTSVVPYEEILDLITESDLKIYLRQKEENSGKCTTFKVQESLIIPSNFVKDEPEDDL